MVKRILLLTLVIIGLALCVCYLLGWRRILDYGQGICFAGVGVIIIGALTIDREHEFKSNIEYQLYKTAGTTDMLERQQQDIQALHSSYSFFFHALLIGILCIICGAFIIVVWA